MCECLLLYAHQAVFQVFGDINGFEFRYESLSQIKVYFETWNAQKRYDISKKRPQFWLTGKAGCHGLHTWEAREFILPSSPWRSALMFSRMAGEREEQNVGVSFWIFMRLGKKDWKREMEKEQKEGQNNRSSFKWEAWLRKGDEQHWVDLEGFLPGP